jgi:type II secretory pathway component GspD/PulD (secretin)
MNLNPIEKILARASCRSSTLFLAALTLATSWLFAISPCIAQVNNGRGATVQLPVTSFFTVNTVVSVPDGGTMSLGGMSRSAAGATSRGVPGLSNLPGIGRGFKNRGIGSEQSTGNVSVRVQVLVMAELEQEVMAEARRLAQEREATDPNGTYATQRKADEISRKMGGGNRRR